MMSELLDYLKNGNFHENFELSKDSNLYFHWSDAKESIEAKTKLINECPAMGRQFQFLLQELEDLKEQTVWIKEHEYVRQASMYDLYLQNIRGNLSVLSRQIISLISANGPFQEIVLGNLLGPKVFDKFVYWQLLNGDLIQRDFRLRVRGKCLIKFVGSENDNWVGEVLQMTKNSLLFEVKSSLAEFITKKNTDFRFYFDLTPFKNINFDRLDGLSKAMGQHGSSLFYSPSSAHVQEVKNTEVQLVTNDLVSVWKNGGVCFWIPLKSFNSNGDNVQKVVSSFLGQVNDVMWKRSA